jgi:hypothetical protein
MLILLLNMKFTAQLQPISNPNQSNLTPEQEWTQAVNRKLFNRIPANAPNVVSQTAEALYTGVLIQLSSVSPDFETGYWELGNNFNNQYLQNPSAFKLKNINDLNLRVNLSWQQTAPFSGAPSPDGDYKMYFYIAVEKQPQGLFDVEDRYLVIKFEFNYDNTAQEFTWTSQTKNLRLSDTIGERETFQIGGDDVQNFNVNPEKITTTQYNELTSEDVTLNILSGFDLGQLDTTYPTPNPVLSANNKAHFEYFIYGNTTPGINTFLDISTTLVFTYSGLFADYTPIS